ncbi:MAG: hypothetical protein U1E89_21015 [Burkholderiaceae bacterium]
MSAETPPPQRVPTLTEVVRDVAPPTSAALPAEAALRPDADIAPTPLLAAALVQEARIAEQVMVRLQPQIDVLFEHRMRDALAPAINRLTTALADVVRRQLASTVREIVARAVAEEVARHRAGG